VNALPLNLGPSLHRRRWRNPSRNNRPPQAVRYGSWYGIAAMAVLGRIDGFGLQAYSQRSAEIGSIRAARRAGIQAARMLVRIRLAATAE
jgi:hypothetical protein